MVLLTTHTPSSYSSTDRLGQLLLRPSSGPPAAVVTGARAGTWVSSLRFATARPKPSTSASPAPCCVRIYPPLNLFPTVTPWPSSAPQRWETEARGGAHVLPASV